VFAFQIDVLDGEQSETFYADTEMPWAEFRDRVVRILGDPHKVQLSGKIIGEGKWGILNGVEGLSGMMQRLVQKANNARTKAVALEVKNTAVSSFFKKNRQKSNSLDIWIDSASVEEVKIEGKTLSEGGQATSDRV
jgi:hypothetical protein